VHVVVVGAGISGLAAAEELLRSNAKATVTLLDSAPEIGGMIRTERYQGYLIERGPDVILAGKPAGVDFCARVGLGNRLQGTAPTGRAYVRRGRHLHRLPAGLSGLVPTQAGPLLRSSLISWPGKLRALAEPLVPARPDGPEESVEAFVVRRLGREMYEWLVEPLLSGIYAGEGSRLSIDAAFPQLRSWETQYGSLLRGARRREHPAGAAFVSLPGGLGELVEAAAAALRGTGRATMRTATGVRTIAATSGGVPVVITDAGEQLAADAVIVAASATGSAAVVRDAAPELADLLAAVPMSSVAIVTLAYDASAIRHVLDASGYVVPRADSGPVLACTWSSAKFPGRAPAGKALVRVFFGGGGREAAALQDDDSLLHQAQRELATILGASGDPELSRVVRWRDAMPQYTLGHRARVRSIAERVALVPWLALAGNALNGVGIPDCIHSGQLAARRVLAGMRA
jgi:protoporphyrinogen/coproporphyrinogen III oxidase